MDRLPLVLVCLLIGSGGRIYAVESTKELSFGEVLTAGLTRSLEAQRATLALQLAADDRRVLSYENDPRFTVNANLTTPKPSNTLVAPNTQANIAREQVYSVQLTATLYDFGRHSTRMEQADYVEQVRKLAHAEVLEALRYRTARAYAGVLAAERIVQISTEQVAVEQAKLKDQQLNYQRGLRPESDVVMAEVTLGRAKMALSTAISAARSARMQLGLLMGEDQQPLLTHPVPAKSLSLSSPERWEHLLYAWKKFNKSATQLRNEMESNALKSDENLVSAARRPTLQGTIDANRSGPYKGPLRNYFTGTLALRWEIPWNGMARDETARIGTRRLDIALQEQLNRKVRTDLDSLAREQFHAAQTQLQQLNEQLKLVAREQELVNRRYLAGKASALEVSTAETDLLTQKLASVTLLNAMALRVIDVAEARAETSLEGVFL